MSGLQQGSREREQIRPISVAVARCLWDPTACGIVPVQLPDTFRLGTVQ